MPARNKLRVCVRREPKPRVASVNGLALHRWDVLLLRADEAPDFIDLEALALEALEHAVLIPGGGMAGVYNELADCCLTHAGESRDSADRHSFAQKMDDLGALIAGQLVHVCESSEGFSLCQALLNSLGF